jgi:hypothetical protein
MTQTLEPGLKSEHGEGERCGGDGVQTTNAEHDAIRDNSENLRPNIVDLETNSSFGFLQHSVRLSRGARHAVVDVEVSFLYRGEVSSDKYPDVRAVISDTLAFLRNYPEKRAYWEIYARDAASKLFKDYGVFSSLTVILVIHPDNQRAFLRIATATVRAVAGSLHSAGTERCSAISARSSPSVTTSRDIVGQQGWHGLAASAAVTQCSTTEPASRSWRRGIGVPASRSATAPRPNDELRIYQIAGAATALLFAGLAPALVMASLWYTAKIAPITFAFTFAIAFGHAVLLGLPLFLVFRLKGWVNVMSCVALGFAVGAVPASVLTLPVEHPEFHTSASVDGVPTSISGVITSTGWFSDVKPPIYFGSLGALGGFAFWVASIWCGICGKAAEAIVRTSCSSRYCLTRFHRG